MSFIESVTSDLVAKALDFSLYRHSVIANNVANAGVDGYTPRRVDFQQVFGELNRLISMGASDETLKEAVMNADSRPMPTLDEVAVKVSIDQEMVKLTENTIRYQALLRARGELGELTKLAVSGGR